MNQLLQNLRNLGPMRLAALAGTFLAVIIFFSFLATKMGTGPMALLYSNLDPADGGQIIAQLDTQKIPYEVSNNGTSIKVPTEQVGKLRMSMAEMGLPRGGSIGYEIFDQKDGFSTTSFVQNINQLRALEGELARTISTLTPIQSARVHLVMPKREMFSQTEQRASASVFLKMRAASGLSKEQVASVRQLIASAVPGLQSDNIAIVDDRGNLLAKAVQSGSAEADSTNNDSMREAYEKQQVGKIEELLSRSLGYGKVRAQVSAEMDFDKVSTTSEIFDPESQVVRSQVTSSEEGKSTEAPANAVSATNNLPAAPPANAGAGNSNNNNKTEETINYEINKTVRNHVRESGNVKKQTVAVLVDGTYETNEEKKQIYKPRSKEDLEQIKALVKTAVNIDPARGDTLEVVNMQFAQGVDGEMAGASDEIAGFPKGDLMRLAESLIMAVVGLLAVLLVVRPILKQVLEGAGAAMSEGGALLAGTGAAGAGANLLPGTAVAGGRLPPPTGALGAQLAGEAGKEEESTLEQMMDLSRVEGRVKASSIKKVAEIVDKHPEESVSIIRNWIYQES